MRGPRGFNGLSPPRPPSRPRTLEPWRKTFAAVWIGLFLVSTGLLAVLPTLPLYIEQRFGLDDPRQVEWWTGVVFGAAPLTAAVCGPVWGLLGDRVGRKPMVLRAVLAIGLVLLAMPYAEAPWQLAALRVVQGMFSGYIAPAMALVSSHTPAERQGRVLGRLQVALALGMLAGPAIGAELAAALGRSAVFTVTGALAVLAAVPIMVLVQEDRGGLQRDSGLWTDAKTRFRRLLRNRVFLAFLALVFTMRCGQHMAEPYIALFVRHLGAWDVLAASARDAAHAVDRTIATAFIVLALAQILVTTLWGRLADRLGPLLCLAVLCLGLGVTLWLQGAQERIGGFLVLRCVAALFLAGAMTLAYAAAGKRVAPERRSLAFALVQSGFQLGMALGPVGGAAWVRWVTATETVAMGVMFRLAAGVLAVTGLAMLLLRAVPGGRHGERSEG